MNTKRTATDGILIALAMILGFVDSMIPMPVPVAGIKLGLANLVVLYAIYRIGYIDAILISLIRVVLSGFMFAGFSGILYSMSGAILSYIVMSLMKRYTDYHVITVSICGSLAHIAGQLLTAGCVAGMNIIPYYGPVLMLSALIAGAATGVIDDIILKNTKGLAGE